MSAIINWDDRWLSNLFNFGIQHPAEKQLYFFFANWLVYVFVAILLAWWFTRNNRAYVRKAITEALFSFIIGRLILVEAIRRVIDRDRPHIADVVYNIPLSKQHEPSFPSGHASGMFVIAMTIYFYNRKLGWLLLAMSAVTGVFRVVTGFHFPTDIIGGAVLGILTSWAVHKYMENWSGKWSQIFSGWSDKILPFTK